MCIQFFRCWETYAVDTLEHLVLAVALPISTGVADQLEVLAEFYIVYVRSTAEISKIALIVNRDIAILKILDQV